MQVFFSERTALDEAARSFFALLFLISGKYGLLDRFHLGDFVSGFL